MRRKRLFITGGLVLGATLVFLLWPRGPEEPVYQGKRLSSWLWAVSVAGRPENEAATREVVQSLGTNALPYLLFEFERDEPKWKRSLARWDFVRKTLNLRTEPEPWRHLRAFTGLLMLGSNAAPALASIARYLETSDDRPFAKSRAFEAVMIIGETGSAGLPYVIGALSSTNAETVGAALVCVMNKRTNASWALPALIKLLDRPDPSIRRMAIVVLSAHPSHANQVVPTLRKALSDSDSEVRRKAMSGLASFEATAKPAVPDLLRLLKDPDPQVAVAAKYALERIDPSAVPVRD